MLSVKMDLVGVDESWLVMLYAFLVHTVADGLLYTLGLIGTDLIERRNYSREWDAWVSTIFLACHKLTALLASFLYRKMGCKVSVILGGLLIGTGYFLTSLTSQDEVSVFLLIGGVGGLGYNFLYIPTWIASNTYYRERRQIANGLVMSGSALGIVAFTPFVDFLMNTYGLQGVFMILGGVGLNTIVIGALIPPLKSGSLAVDDIKLNSIPNGDEKDEHLSEQEENAPLLNPLKQNYVYTFIAIDLFRNWKYTIYVLASCLVDPITLHTFYIYVPDYVIYLGYPHSRAWQLIAVAGITNTSARLLMGWSKKSTLTISIVYSMGTFLAGLTLLTLASPHTAQKHWLIFVVAGLYGYGKGIFWSLRGPVLAEIIPIEDFDRALGTEQFFTGFFVLMCPLQGKLFDITGMYTWTFVMSGGMVVLGSVLLSVVTAGFVRFKK